MKTCKDYPEAESCCISCHEDYNEGWDWPLEIEDENLKVIARVCCAKARWIDEQKS